MNVKSNDDLLKKNFNVRKCTFNGKTGLNHNQSLFLAHSGLGRLLTALKTLRKRRNPARHTGSFSI